MPCLYHKHVGHDNSRDGDYLHMVESQYVAEVLYREWKPQAYPLEEFAFAYTSVMDDEIKSHLIGIRAQHRAQTDGTFKLLFNALLQ